MRSGLRQGQPCIRGWHQEGGRLAQPACPQPCLHSRIGQLGCACRPGGCSATLQRVRWACCGRTDGLQGTPQSLTHEYLWSMDSCSSAASSASCASPSCTRQERLAGFWVADGDGTCRTSDCSHSMAAHNNRAQTRTSSRCLTGRPSAAASERAALVTRSMWNQSWLLSCAAICCFTQAVAVCTRVACTPAGAALRATVMAAALRRCGAGCGSGGGSWFLAGQARPGGLQ